jgi:3',5'-cyclic AMP phosphodiesterase CpdA
LSAAGDGPGRAPDWTRTIHGVGDLHAGGIGPARMDAVMDDVCGLPAPALHLQIGDATENGTAAEDEIVLDWLGRLPGPYRAILGNHDIVGNRRTVAQWARAYGRRSKNFVVDLPFVRVIAVGPDQTGPGRRCGRLSPRTLEWLGRQLARSPRECWIACHWPLRRTVLGDQRRLFTSAMTSFYAKPDHDIRALLARHRNARAWLSGHTHSPLTAPGLVTRARLGHGRSIVAVNLSALVAVGKRRNPGDPLCSVYLTHRRGGIEVRFRDHRVAAWMAAGREHVLEVAL